MRIREVQRRERFFRSYGQLDLLRLEVLLDEIVFERTLEVKTFLALKWLRGIGYRRQRRHKHTGGA